MTSFPPLTHDLLSRLSSLRPSELRTISPALGAAEWARCAEDVIYWLDPTLHADVPYVHTLDNHPQYRCGRCAADTAPMGAFKRAIHMQITHGWEQTPTGQELKSTFTELPTTRPFTLHPYMRPIIEAWLNYPHMLIEKSRDMMATWLFVTLYTWDTLFHHGRQNIFQSEDAQKTRELVKRSEFIFLHQPSFLRKVHPAYFTEGQSKSGIFNVPSINSEILGFPQGPDQIRQYHPTGVFTDETAFQVEAEAGFQAIKPAIENGRYTGVSTAKPGWFQAMCRDNISE